MQPPGTSRIRNLALLHYLEKGPVDEATLAPVLEWTFRNRPRKSSSEGRLRGGHLPPLKDGGPIEAFQVLHNGKKRRPFLR